MSDVIELSLLRAAILNPVQAFVYADWLEEQGELERAQEVRARTGLVRRTDISPAYDKRPKKEGEKNYGIGAAMLSLAVIGPKGAVAFSLFTQWYLEHVREELIERHLSGGDEFALNTLFRPQGADLGYHSRQPMREGDKPLDKKCPYLGGSPCYYDGSGLAAAALMDRLLVHGIDVVWEDLENRYRSMNW